MSKRQTLQQITEQVRARSTHELIHEGDGVIVVEGHYRPDASPVLWVNRGVAKCAPQDTYDFDTGWKWATRRATTKIARRVYAKQQAELKGAYRLARHRLIKAKRELGRCLKCHSRDGCDLARYPYRKEQFATALAEYVVAADALLEEVR